MTILIVVGVVLMLPFICKLAIVYITYFQWALRVPPIKILLNIGKRNEPMRKRQIGFPVEAVTPELALVNKKEEKKK